MSIQIAYVADKYKRYPGETITYFARVTFAERLSGVVVRILLPENVEENNYQAQSSYGDVVPDLEINRDGRFLAWRITADVEADTIYDYEVTVRISPTKKDVQLLSIATVTGRKSRQQSLSKEESELSSASETVMVQVFAKGDYLRYLPALYDSDEFMSRFLMLFESFWQPIDTQIDHIDYYFTCKLSPTHFLPYLASWVSLELDERWTEEQQRMLVCTIIQLYRKRGTVWGLSKFLEIYTGVWPDIIEHRARNFAIGPQARLGQGLALGSSNQPHTFTVTMALPPIPEEDETRRQQKEAERRRNIEQIIDYEKPAHTGYRLILEEID